MIKFFRKIRENLISENQFNKYLLYAIGEIILVVIGILIALQINNWNEQKRERRIEQEYLISLKSEFNTNLEKVNISIAKAKDILNGVNGLIALFDKDVSNGISSDSVDKRLQVLGKSFVFQPTRGVLSDIVSSGNLNTITSQKLRQRIASFESLVEDYKRQENAAQTKKDKIKTILFKEGSLRKIANDEYNVPYQSISENVDNKLIFYSIELENHLFEYALFLKSVTSNEMFLGTIKKEIETILKEIDQELE
ncbi:DUF6090 family protein [Robiginitalea sp. IMCC44478]|uniref:DUF6090 family protein n=1 Tax=Robiginitalea sp. IMCC44478 TaxID=3459122 RepID=UPI004042D115